MVPETGPDGIGPAHEIRTVLSAELIQADLPMLGVGMTATIKS